MVLTVHPRAYERRSDDQIGDIPPGVVVHRAFALDSARHLAIAGRYSRLTALPDRWISWVVGAVPSGVKLIRRYRPDAIWSTYPIASAHVAGLLLRRLTRLPWVADFRDSMTDDTFPPSASVRRMYRWIERHSVHQCSRAVFTTPGAVSMYAARYPELSFSRLALIENGYDEESFRDAETIAAPARESPAPGPLTLVHSGLVYPSDRDPQPLFDALAALRASQTVSEEDLHLVFRASGSEEYFRRLLDERELNTIVTLKPPIPYREALAEMLTADGLLVLQASSCNHQIPAKVYEYIRTGRPILGLTDPAGDTASVLRRAGIDTIARLDSTEDIRRALPEFISLLRAKRAPVASAEERLRHSRRSRTVELADILNQVCGDDSGRVRWARNKRG